MRVLVGLSGGVDSSVAAAVLRDEGHDVVGATMKLWGGTSDRGCCSASDVDDARRSAQQLGIDHHVFNFSEEFDRHVVEPYVNDHRVGRTPNPCVECNRHLKFDRFVERALALGFDAVATGHHARRVRHASGTWTLGRGADRAKDQSYVLHPVLGERLESVLFPIGDMTKDEVRHLATRHGLVTADKPDSQDVCFITASMGRASFLGDRIPLRSGRVVDTSGTQVGTVDAIETVTIGQRKGLGLSGGGAPRYVVDVDVGSSTVTVGLPDDLLRPAERLEFVAWVSDPRPLSVEAQISAHGRTAPAELIPTGASSAEIRWSDPQRRVASGQSVVAYIDDVVVAGGSVA